MRNSLLIVLFFVVMSAGATPAAIIKPAIAADTSIQTITLPLPQLLSLLDKKPRDVTKLNGEKLNFSEKIAFGILQKKLKKQVSGSTAYPSKDNGKTAFILGLIGLIGILVPVVNLASLPLAILAIVIGSKARKQDPDNRKARTAVT